MSTTLDQPAIQPPEPKLPRNRRTLIVVLAGLLVIATATAVTLAVFSRPEGSEPSLANPPSAGPSTGAPSAARPTTTSVTTPSQPTVLPFGDQPLWPFTNLAGVTAWQDAYRSGGHAPWHLDADATALAFTTGYLRFTGISVVVSHSLSGTEALVAVGYSIENHLPGTAAVLHLAKFGSGADAPWEVVGTKDTTLTVTQPRYGATVSPPVTVGGTITGVDESVRVQVRQPFAEQPLGQTDGMPAGGTNTPWSTTLTYQGATAPALTIVAFTGGHYADVERFAITAIRPAA